MRNPQPSRRVRRAFLFALALIIAGCHKSNSEFDAGRKAEAIQDYDTALLHYETAARANPTDAEYKLRVVHARYAAANFHMEQGQKALQKGDLQLAMSEFEKAYGIDPSNVAAEQQMKKTADLLAVANGTQAPAKPDDFNADEKELMAGPPQLQALSHEPVNMKMTNDSRVIFETIAKLAGLCVIFDPDYVSRRITAELPGVTLEQALDAVSFESKAFWKPLTSTVIEVAPDNPQKRKDIEDEQVATFYVANSLTPQDLTEIVNGLRQRGQGKIVGEKDQLAGILLVAVADAAQRLRITFQGIETLQADRLVAAQAGALVHGPRSHAAKAKIFSRANDEKCQALRQVVQPREVQVPAIEKIKSARFRQQLIEDANFVDFGWFYVDSHRNAAAQIQQRVHLDGGVQPSVARPGKQRKTQIDGRAVQSVGGFFQLHQLLDLHRIQQVNAQNAIIVRDTPDKLDLAAKVIADIDKAKPEVLLHVQVLSANRDRLRQLGILPGQNVSLAFNPRCSVQSANTDCSSSSSSSTTDTNPLSVTLNNLKRLSTADYSITLPGASAEAVLTDNDTKIIQDPEIRVTDGEKAVLKIGQRVPVATGSTQAATGVGAGSSVASLVNTQFQYIDVGVNIEAQPRVHPDGSVSMKLSVEVSAVANYQNIGGISEPVISQRKIEHEVRLQNGEVNILGGLIERTTTNDLNGIPGAASVPGFKYLFSQTDKEVVDDEVLIILTPHILRFSGISKENLRRLASGSDSNVRVFHEVSDDARLRQQGRAMPAAPFPVAPSVPPAPGQARSGDSTRRSSA